MLAKLADLSDKCNEDSVKSSLYSNANDILHFQDKAVNVIGFRKTPIKLGVM